MKNSILEYQFLMGSEKEDNESLQIIQIQKEIAKNQIRKLNEEYNIKMNPYDPFDLLMLLLSRKRVFIRSQCAFQLKKLLTSIACKNNKNLKQIIQFLSLEIYHLSLENFNELMSFYNANSYFQDIEVQETMAYVRQKLEMDHSYSIKISEITELQQLEMEINIRKHHKDKLQKQLEKNHFKKS